MDITILHNFTPIQQTTGTAPTPTPIVSEDFLLTNQTLNATRRDLVQGANPTVINVLDRLDDHFTALMNWNELNLIRATAVVQYLQTGVLTHARPDFTSAALQYGSADDLAWGGELDAPPSGQSVPGSQPVDSVYYVRILPSSQVDQSLHFFLGSGIVVANDFVIESPFEWLGETTFANVQTHFTTNTYSTATNYYYYDTDLEEVREYTQTASGSTWTTLTGTQDEVSASELTVDASGLISTGIISVHLTDNAITSTKINTFRILVTLTD